MGRSGGNHGHGDKAREARQRATAEKRAAMMESLAVAVGLEMYDSDVWNIRTPPQIYLPEQHAPVLVSLDIELWELDRSTVTEIGIATLDPLLIDGVPPQDRGKAWWNYIYAQHIRSRENMDMVNDRFVAGCPEAFNFGKSLIISAQSQAKMVTELLKAVVYPRRPLYIVGHAPDQDIEHLRRIGVNFDAISPNVSVIDTREVYCSVFAKNQGPSLTNLLATLNIDKTNLHNAGNDAVYTLRCALAMAVCVTERDPFAFKNRAMLGWDADAGFADTDLGLDDDDDDYLYNHEYHRDNGSQSFPFANY